MQLRLRLYLTVPWHALGEGVTTKDALAAFLWTLVGK
jgi:hypothetical protein